jgi:SAM-dependent methyltransferase
MSAMDYSKIAQLYDVYVQTDLDVHFFRQAAQGCGKVLELTAGTGRLSLPLLEAGIPLSCLDNSPEMLAILRSKLQAKGLSAPIYEMDMSRFSLPARFDLIIIPFNSFAEIVSSAAQQATLATIYTHLTDTGHLICTLHNPAIRLKNIDGQIRLRGQYALPNHEGILFLWSCENYDPNTHLVRGAQFYELYTDDGVMQWKRYVALEFFVHSKETFEALAYSQGFRVTALYGDYERAEFQPDKSPFMIWVLSKQ